MKIKRFSKILAFCYVVALVVVLLVPRSFRDGADKSGNALTGYLHEILYYSGPLEPLGNFFLLIPIFLLVASLAKNHQMIIALSTCVFISVMAEIGQAFIPGRVSSTQDLALNIGGVCATLMIILVFRLVNSQPRISE